MKIELMILNPLAIENEAGNVCWYIRRKAYETNIMEPIDADIKNSTIGHKLDRLVINDVQITSNGGITELIEFLEKAKGSF